MKFTYKQFSSYRKEIMGIAIFLIMFCHNTFIFPGFLNNINSGLKMLGQSGVDIFFFLSGFGCYYSMKNNSKPAVFYKKRLIKLFPPYLFVIVINGLLVVPLSKTTLIEYIDSYSLISFFTKADLHEWFIASILVLYLLYPIIFYLINNKKEIAIAILGLLYLFLLLYSARLFRLHNQFPNIVSTFVVRIPAFLFGSFFAKKSFEGKPLISNRFSYLCIFGGVIASSICLVLYKLQIKHYWLIIRLLFVVVAFGVMFLWVYIRESFPSNNRVLKLLIRFFTYMGPITLEIYLIHEKLLSIVTPITGFLDPLLFITNLIAIALSVIFAHYLNKLFTNLLFA